MKLHLLIAGIVSLLAATTNAQIRDVRTYRIIDSGYIGRAGGVPQDVYWIDNHRLVFIGFRPAEHAEREYGLYVWDLDAKTVTLHHEGSLYSSICVFKGVVRFEFEKNGVHYLFQGRFGGEQLVRLSSQALEERRRNERALNAFTCDEYQYSQLPARGWRVYPLLDGEFLNQEREPAVGEVIHLKFWSRKGPPVLLNLTPHLSDVERYSEFMDTYVLNEAPFRVLFGDNVIRRSWLMDRNGRTQEFSPPSGPWMRGTTYVAPTKRGIFLMSHAVYGGGNGAAGGYLLEGGQFNRVIAGLPTRFDVSPDGCRVALPISEIRRDVPHTPAVKVIDLCSRGP